MLLDAGAQARRMSDGFVNELAVAWPVTHGRLGRPVLAAVGSREDVRVVPQRVFRCGLRHGTDGVVLAHTHARSTGPSGSDIAVTRRLVAAGHVLGIPLLAHLVVEPDAVHDIVTGTVLDAPNR